MNLNKHLPDYEGYYAASNCIYTFKRLSMYFTSIQKESGHNHVLFLHLIIDNYGSTASKTCSVEK